MHIKGINYQFYFNKVKYCPHINHWLKKYFYFQDIKVYLWQGVQVVYFTNMLMP